MNRWVALALLAALALGAGLRLARLERRPLHNDEAVNAIKTGELWNTGRYVYDPNEHHGPTLYYAAAAFNRLTRAPDFNDFSVARFRVVTVLFGLGMILLLPLIADGLGRRGTAWAALLTALSPAMVYYSRYYIHEMLLVFAALLALGGAWRYWRARKVAWAVVAGVGLGLMQATKETFVLSWAAAVFALALNLAWNRYVDASAAPRRAPPLDRRHLAAGLGAWLVVVVVLFTSFFTNAGGPLDSIRTYFPWLQRVGGDSPHLHPWNFYLHRLLWFDPGKGPPSTEGLIVALALLGAYAGFDRKHLGRADANLVRFLALYTLALAGIYSLIAYKTPWCLLGFWHTAILLAGVGTAVLWRKLRPPALRAGVGILLVAGVAHLGWQAWQAAVVYGADRRNPYVYAHTSPDVQRLVQTIEKLAQSHPAGKQMLIKVVAPESDYWPLPYHLRNFSHVGWWQALPEDPYAPVMIVAAGLNARLDEKKTHLMVGYFELRPEVFLELYVELELWKKYLADNPPPPAPE